MVNRFVVPVKGQVMSNQRIICTNDDEIKNQFSVIAKAGYVWHTPITLYEDEYFDEVEGVPQVDEKCPNCGFISNRYFNSTDYRTNISWQCETCFDCDCTWFDTHERNYGK